jgi:LPXTG-motif cell wall-anchored protein
VIVVTACAEDATASGGSISWTGADSRDSLTLFSPGILAIQVYNGADNQTPASGSYGPLEAGDYTYQFVDNTNEFGGPFSGSFTIARCATTPTPTPTPSSPSTPLTGAGIDGNIGIPMIGLGALLGAVSLFGLVRRRKEDI